MVELLCIDFVSELCLCLILLPPFNSFTVRDRMLSSSHYIFLIEERHWKRYRYCTCDYFWLRTPLHYKQQLKAKSTNL
jgi:hypothetical protein